VFRFLQRLNSRRALYALFPLVIVAALGWGGYRISGFSIVPEAMKTGQRSSVSSTKLLTPKAVRPSLTPTWTRYPTLTPSMTLVPTSTWTPSPTATPIPTETPTPSATPIPLPTPDGIVRALQVPILMYHHIAIPPEGADAIRRDLSVPPERFAEHLCYLRDQGYTSISLHELALALQVGHPLPPKPIVLTFDDGYRDNYLHAFPLLQRYGFRGTFFLITGYIDEGRPEYMTWEQVKEMSAAGMEMEAHCYTHVDLRGRDVDYLIWQILGPKEAIEARTHRPVRFFSYPSGQYDELVMRVLHSAHYWGAVTVHQGIIQRSDRMFELGRIRVHGDYTARDLARVLMAFRALLQGQR